MKEFIGFGEIQEVEKKGAFHFAKVKTRNGGVLTLRVTSDDYEEGETVKLYKDSDDKIFLEVDPCYVSFYRCSAKHLFLYDYNIGDVGYAFGSESAFLLAENGNDVEKIGHSSVSDGSQMLAGKDFSYIGTQLVNYSATTGERAITKNEQCSELKGNRLFCSSLDTALTYEFSISSLAEDGALQTFADVDKFETTELVDDFHKTLGHFGLSVLSLAKITKIKGEGVSCLAKLMEADNLIFNNTEIDFYSLNQSLMNIDINVNEVNEFELSIIEHDDKETIMIGNSFKNVKNTKIRFSDIDYKVNYLKLITTERTVEISLSKTNLTANLENYSFYSFFGYEHVGFNQSFEIDNPIKITSGKVSVDMSGDFDLKTSETTMESTSKIKLSVDKHNIYIDQQGVKASN